MENQELSMILLNLKVVSMLRPYERLSTVRNKIIVDKPSLFQGFKRWLRGEDRVFNMDVLDQLIRKSIIYLLGSSLPQTQKRLMDALVRAKLGLVHLKTTYERDSFAIAQIEVLLDLIENTGSCNKIMDRVASSSHLLLLDS